MGRTEWAVTAAEHVLAALWAIQGNDSIEADQALQETRQAYEWLLFSIGTIPGNRREEMFNVTVMSGMAVTAALDLIGA